MNEWSLKLNTKVVQQRTVTHHSTVLTGPEIKEGPKLAYPQFNLGTILLTPNM